MKRRDFNRGLLGTGVMGTTSIGTRLIGTGAATGLAAPGLILPGRAEARNRDDERSVEQFVRMQLLIGASPIVVTYLVFLLTQAYVLNFRRTVLRYPLASTLVLGFLAATQGRQLAQRFAAARVLGDIYLLGTILFLLPALRLSGGPGRTMIANDESLFVHPGTPRQGRLSQMPDTATLRRRRPDGKALINEQGEVLIGIEPINAPLGVRF